MTRALLPTGSEDLRELSAACEYSASIGDKYLRRYGLDLSSPETWAVSYPVAGFETTDHQPTRTPSQLGTLMVLSGAKVNLRRWLDTHRPRLEDSYWTWPQHYVPTPNPGDRVAHLLEVLVICQRSKHLVGLREEVIAPLQQLIVEHPGLLHPRFGFKLRARHECAHVSLAGALAVLDVPLPSTPPAHALASSAVVGLGLQGMSSRCWSQQTDPGAHSKLKSRSLRNLAAQFGPQSGDFMRSVLELYGGIKSSPPPSDAGLADGVSDDAYLAGRAFVASAMDPLTNQARTAALMCSLNASGFPEHRSFREALVTETCLALGLDADGQPLSWPATSALLTHLRSLTASWLPPGREGAAELLAKLVLGAPVVELASRIEQGCSPCRQSCVHVLSELAEQGLPLDAIRAILDERPGSSGTRWSPALDSLQLEAAMRRTIETSHVQQLSPHRRRSPVL